MSKAEECVGKRFGRWQAIGVCQSKRRNANQHVTCRCDCGTVRDVHQYNLRSGVTSSCGCAGVKDIEPGEQFGAWTVLHETERGKGGDRRYMCECNCGTVSPVCGTFLRNGGSTRCIKCRKRTHGMADSETYKSYQKMLERCYSESSISFPRYGGRGISVCDRWRDSFDNFLSDMGIRPGKTYSLERIDNDGDYDPKNCKWATAVEQGRNKRNNRILVVNGEARCVAEWSEITGVGQATIRARLKRGDSPIVALRKVG